VSPRSGYESIDEVADSVQEFAVNQDINTGRTAVILVAAVEKASKRSGGW
jgi:hypothetical protein